MKTQHTPGPWKTNGKGTYSEILSSDGYIGTIKLPQDARLIAAAPELLACLQSALSDLEHLKQCAVNNLPGEFSIGMFKRMDDYGSIIKKAKGE